MSTSSSPPRRVSPAWAVMPLAVLAIAALWVFIRPDPPPTPSVTVITSDETLPSSPSAASPTETPPPLPPARVRYITPNGAGSGDGSSWAEAGRLEDLPRFVEASEPGEEVWLHGGQGPYPTDGPVMLRHGGSVDAPVVVRGVDEQGGSATPAEFVGDRADPYTPSGQEGEEVFRLLRGADHLRFENLAFRNQGNGCFRIAEDITDLTIRSVRAGNVGRLVENYATEGTSSATVTGLMLTDVEVLGFSRGVLRLQYDSSAVVLEDVLGDAQEQLGEEYPAGVALDGTVHDVLLRRVTMRNARSVNSDDSYWNGDGFTAEQGTHDLHYEDTLSVGHTDGGYDLKSTATTLVRAVAEGNGRNFRFWGTEIDVSSCVGRDPYKRGGTGSQVQVQVAETADVRLEDCAFDDADPDTLVFDLRAGAVLDVQGGHVRHHPGARLQKQTEGARFALHEVDVAPSHTADVP